MDAESAGGDHPGMRRQLPSATVTFLFTDVEGSTRLLHELGAEAYAEALAEHRRVVRTVFAAEGGVEVDTQGDAFFYVFADARRHLRADLPHLHGRSRGRHRGGRGGIRDDPRAVGAPCDLAPKAGARRAPVGESPRPVRSSADKVWCRVSQSRAPLRVGARRYSSTLVATGRGTGADLSCPAKYANGW